MKRKPGAREFENLMRPGDFENPGEQEASMYLAMLADEAGELYYQLEKRRRDKRRKPKYRKHCASLVKRASDRYWRRFKTWIQS